MSASDRVQHLSVGGTHGGTKGRAGVASSLEMESFFRPRLRRMTWDFTPITFFAS